MVPAVNDYRIVEEEDEEDEEQEETIEEVILYAARAGDLELLEEAVKAAGPTIDWNDVKDPQSGNTPLHVASANGHLEVVELLMGKYKVSVNTANDAGNTALHYACLMGELKVVQCLVKYGVSTVAKNEAGLDALYEAELNRKDTVVQWLLENVPAYSQPADYVEDEGVKEEVT